MQFPFSENSPWIYGRPTERPLLVRDINFKSKRLSIQKENKREKICSHVFFKLQFINLENFILCCIVCLLQIRCLWFVVCKDCLLPEGRFVSGILTSGCVLDVGIVLLKQYKNRCVLIVVCVLYFDFSRLKSLLV